MKNQSLNSEKSELSFEKSEFFNFQKENALKYTMETSNSLIVESVKSFDKSSDNN